MLLTVDAKDAGIRIDVFLAQNTELTRSAAQKLLEKGAFTVGGRPAKKNEKTQAVAQAVMDTKIDELTREVREHNGFAQKMPVIQTQVDALDRRVSALEKYHQQPTN